jgi:hypothetical protein
MQIVSCCTSNIRIQEDSTLDFGKGVENGEREIANAFRGEGLKLTEPVQFISLCDYSHRKPKIIESSCSLCASSLE